MIDVPLGQLALERGWISQDQLDSALRRQQEIAASEPNRFRRLGHLLVKEGVLTPAQVAELLADQGIAIYRSVGSGRQYNVHQANPKQTYLSPEDSAPMERVAALQLRKVIVVDDINRVANSNAPVERMVAPPGALQAQAHTPPPPPTKAPPKKKKKPAATPEPSAGRKRKPTMEEILARSADAPARPEQDEQPEPAQEEEAAEVGLNFDVDTVPAPSEPPSLFGGFDDAADNDEAADYLVGSAVDDDDSGDIDILAPRPSERSGPPVAKDRSDVDLDLAALSPKGSGRKAQTPPTPGEQLFPPLAQDEAEEETVHEPPVAEDPAAPAAPPAAAVAPAPSVALDLVAEAGVGMDIGFVAAAATGKPPTLDSAAVIYTGRAESSADMPIPAAQLTPIWEQVADEATVAEDGANLGQDGDHSEFGESQVESLADELVPSTAPNKAAAARDKANLGLDDEISEFGESQVESLADELVPGVAPNKAAAAEDKANLELDSQFGELQVESLADEFVPRVALEELQAPAEKIEFDDSVPEPAAFPDLAPGSAPVDYAMDDAPEPEGPMLGESLIDGGLTRPEGGFGFRDEPPPPLPSKDSPAIPVKPLDDSQDELPAAPESSDESGTTPLAVDSAEVRRVTGTFDRSSIDTPPLSDAQPLDDLDDLNDDEH